MPLSRRLSIVLLAAALALLAWLPLTQAAGIQASRDGLKRALVTYASVRAIDAVISVAQQTEITLQPGGVGAGFGVGQALEPLDDLIEQFSALMQWVLVAFGLQTMLAQLGAHMVVTALLTLALGALALLAWRGAALPHWLKRAAVVLLVVRFAVPVYAVAAEGLHCAVLSPQYAQAQRGLEASRGSIDQAAAPAAGAAPQPAVPRWYERWLPDALKETTLPRLPSVASISERVELSIERLIDLAVLFLFETVALPLAFFWFLRAAVGAALATRASTTAGVAGEAPAEPAA